MRRVTLLTLAGLLLLPGCEADGPATGGPGALPSAIAPLPPPVPRDAPPVTAAPEPPPAEITIEPAPPPGNDLPAGAAATLAGLRLLDTAGRAAMARAEALLAAPGAEGDHCALRAVLAVGERAGPADGARFALWLHDRIRARAAAAPGVAEVAAGILGTLREGAAEAGVEAARLAEFPEATRLAEHLALARATPRGCGGEGAARLGEWLAERPA